MVEEHSLMVTQALECLQLYWLGVGDAYAGNLCLGKPFAFLIDIKHVEDLKWEK